MKIKGLNGFKDILPDQVSRWMQVETVARNVFQRFHFAEIRVPILEKTELFARSIGADTDIVEKEMYTFRDRNEESLTLRPEATAGLVRAGITNGLLHNQRQKLWTAGPMFRYEKPQKGRYRQFHQIGAELLGDAGPESDAELLAMLVHFLGELGRLYKDVSPPEIRRFRPGTGPRVPLMRFGLRPVEGAGSIDAAALGGRPDAVTRSQ